MKRSAELCAFSRRLCYYRFCHVNDSGPVGPFMVDILHGGIEDNRLSIIYQDVTEVQALLQHYDDLKFWWKMLHLFCGVKSGVLLASSNHNLLQG